MLGTMNVRVPADAALIPPDTGASTNWAKTCRKARQSILLILFVQYLRPSLSTWQPFACASCESCLLSAGSTLHQMKHQADVSKTFCSNTLTLTVLQSISRLPLIALSSTSWNRLELSLKKSCNKNLATLYTVSTIALFGNIVTTLSDPAATLWRKDRSKRKSKTKMTKW